MMRPSYFRGDWQFASSPLNSDPKEQSVWHEPNYLDLISPL